MEGGGRACKLPQPASYGPWGTGERGRGGGWARGAPSNAQDLQRHSPTVRSHARVRVSVQVVCRRVLVCDARAADTGKPQSRTLLPACTAVHLRCRFFVVTRLEFQKSPCETWVPSVDNLSRATRPTQNRLRFQRVSQPSCNEIQEEEGGTPGVNLWPAATKRTDSFPSRGRRVPGTRSGQRLK